MEELLIFVIQFFVEIVFQLALELILDLIPHTNLSGKPGFVGWLFVYLMVGAALGLSVNVIHPNLFIQSSALRQIHFFASPVLVGASAYGVNRLRSKKDETIKPLRHAAYGFVLALGYGAIRMAYG